MKARPILFSAPMIRALLAGTKTQTRRMVKNLEGRPPTEWKRHAAPALANGCECWSSDSGWMGKCPYGQPGDLLWVRESFAQHPQFADLAYRADDTGDGFEDSDGFLWEPSYKPSIYMPRALSRLTLRITHVRVQRLQDMEGQAPYPGESDALAEGINAIHHGDGAYYYSAFRDDPHPENWGDPTDAFRELWESINGAGSWDENPWVWALTFEVIKANVDQVQP